MTKLARRATFGVAVIFFAASLSILTGCSKSTQEPTAPIPQSSPSSGTTADGYYWQVYVTTGTANITQGTAGNFSCTYSNVGDVVVGKGYNPGSAQVLTYNVSSLTGNYNTVGIYGWTTSPLIEYYIVEFGANIAGTQINTVSSDGHTYTFYEHQQVSQPSIQGTATFWQYLDNWGGASIGSNQTVTMANHVNNWTKNGGQGFGTYNYQILSLEAYGGLSGSVNATISN